jgi:hypothetical protein
MKRECGDCQLCCKLLPMTGDPDVYVGSQRTANTMIQLGLIQPNDFYGAIPDFNKEAGVRCPYQKHNVGCTVYEQRPFGCKIWNCRWLVNDDTAELRRPDRSHYVIDMSPDYVYSNEGHVIPVIQVWVDKKHRDAHQDPVLREYLKRRTVEGYDALIRWDNRYDCMFLCWREGQWHEKAAHMKMGFNSAANIAKMLETEKT